MSHLPDLREASRLLDLGKHIVLLHHNQKRPLGEDWNAPTKRVRRIDAKATGYGLPLVANGLCSIDPDNEPFAMRGMTALDFDLEALMNSGVRTKSTRPGSGGRSAFKTASDLAWLTFRCKEHQTIIEFRAGSSNLQDVIPGLVYADKSGALQTQVYAGDRRLDEATELPEKLHRWWLRCSTDIEYRRDQEAKFFAALGLKPLLSISTGASSGRLAFPSPYRGEFNLAFDVEGIIERHGYEPDGRGRWSPPSATGSPGVRPIPGKDGLWQSDHASDPLHGTFDSWVAHVVLDHEGDFRKAEVAAALRWAETHTDRTDTGNMAVLASLAERELKYVPETKSWIYWTGERWLQDKQGIHAQSAALLVGEYFHRQALDIRRQASDDSISPPDKQRLERVAVSIEAWACQCRNRARIENMLNLAKCNHRFVLPLDRLDTNPYLLGVQNGVVDLRTGVLRAAAREDFVTKCCPIAYATDAAATRFSQFVAEITGTPDFKGGFTNRPELAAYMQRALGYCLTGLTDEHKMFIAFGEGSNGKSVLLDLMQHIAGDYCETVDPGALMTSKYDTDAERPTPGLRKLAGVRMAVSSESKDGQKLDVALIKRHTGGGFLTARALHENAVRFEITHKLWLMTNHKPALDNLDQAMRGRLHLIPFDMRWNRPGIPDRDLRYPDGNKSLQEELRTEAEGVLAWLVHGAVDYFRHGLEVPAAVGNTTQTYFEDQDLLASWLQGYERCTVKEGARSSDLFDDFRSFCDQEGIDGLFVGNNRSFASKLSARGIESKKLDDGRHFAIRRKVESDTDASSAGGDPEDEICDLV